MHDLRLTSDSPWYVIDLRDNPGGDGLSAAQLIAEFTDDPTARVLTMKGKHTEWIYSGGAVSRMLSFLHPSVRKLPRKTLCNHRCRVIVLVNGKSASASEVFTGNLKEKGMEHGRFTVVGERTYGKGTGQELSQHSHASESWGLLTASRNACGLGRSW